jgi:hypothetical protein
LQPATGRLESETTPQTAAKGKELDIKRISSTLQDRSR